MNLVEVRLPNKLRLGEIDAPDLICGGTPCQAFSLAGWKKGLEDVRGNLTLRFVDIVNENDAVRKIAGKPQTIVFWENVEGVLRDKTNAFGCLLASLAGYDDEIKLHKKWPQSGLIRGPVRNVAWRVIDAKFFGLPQQRKRLYLIAGGKDFNPEDVLFEIGAIDSKRSIEAIPLRFDKQGHLMQYAFNSSGISAIKAVLCESRSGSGPWRRRRYFIDSPLCLFSLPTDRLIARAFARKSRRTTNR